MLHTNSGDPLALVGGTLGPPVQGKLQGAGHFKSPSRVAELQGQIKNLSEEQKRALQEQIARNQRQLLHREKSNISDVLEILIYYNNFRFCRRSPTTSSPSSSRRSLPSFQRRRVLQRSPRQDSTRTKPRDILL